MPQDRSALYFRRYHSSDRASLISDCYGGELPPHLLSLLNNEGSHRPQHVKIHVLGMLNQQIVASGYLFKTPAYTEIADLFVKAECRNQGIGQALINHLEKISYQEGWRPLELTVLADNKGAFRLYKRLGFVEKSQFQANGNQVILMSKP